ncbi:hypothetical protein FRB95_009850 [Tulasnella sp. JGI-2019a]|nr:hypothetical protein FRB95_009850 [Tulasnella sp. JGI-2019a]
MTTRISNSENPFLDPPVSNNPFLYQSASKNPFLRRNHFNGSNIRIHFPDTAPSIPMPITISTGLPSTSLRSLGSSSQQPGDLLQSVAAPRSSLTTVPRDHLNTSAFLDSLQEDLGVGTQASLQQAYPPLSPLPNAVRPSLAVAPSRRAEGHPSGAMVAVSVQRPADVTLTSLGTLAPQSHSPRSLSDSMSPPPYTLQPDYGSGEVTMEVEPQISLSNTTAAQFPNRLPVTSTPQSAETLQQMRSSLRPETSYPSLAGPSSSHSADASRAPRGRLSLQDNSPITGGPLDVPLPLQSPVWLASTSRGSRFQCAKYVDNVLNEQD